jgi:acetyl-CoA carboxylase alpha subunit
MSEQKDSRTPKKAHVVLDFERPILELERKIEELETLSKSTGMNLNGEVRPLKDRLGHLVTEIFRNLSPLQVVQVARHPDRPLTVDYVEAVFDDFIEVHGRSSPDSDASAGGASPSSDTGRAAAPKRRWPVSGDARTPRAIARPFAS